MITDWQSLIVWVFITNSLSFIMNLIQFLVNIDKD
nr:MAG TPA: hypothetical protein [Caudoviricetes sp.]DAS08871.1 MAG TPA: hypothetical protein [Caudoviricetes sp.]